MKHPCIKSFSLTAHESAQVVVLSANKVTANKLNIPDRESKNNVYQVGVMGMWQQRDRYITDAEGVELMLLLDHQLVKSQEPQEPICLKWRS